MQKKFLQITTHSILTFKLFIRWSGLIVSSGNCKIWKCIWKTIYGPAVGLITRHGTNIIMVQLCSLSHRNEFWLKIKLIYFKKLLFAQLSVFYFLSFQKNHLRKYRTLNKDQRKQVIVPGVASAYLLYSLN